MKYLIVFFSLLLTTFIAHAQEVLLPLHSNPTQNTHSATSEKGYRPDFSDFCRPPQAISALSEVKATCGNADGSITLQLSNISLPYNLAFSGTAMPLSTSTGNNDPEITLSNLPAGAYFFTATDAEGRVLHYRHELNNIGAPLTSPTHWELVPSFCSEKGKLKKRAFTPGAVGSFELYRQDHSEETSYSGLTSYLDPGTYYLMRKGNNDCNSFYIFDIASDPSISMPFLDDFASSSVVPDNKYWQGSCVLINDSYAWQPFTMGCATFDGLNCEGQPYEPVASGAELIDGHADILNSQPACLADQATEGDTLYLSFLYQPKGMGDYPNTNDSLFVEILTKDEQWHTVWAAWNDGDNIVTSQNEVIEFSPNIQLPFRYVLLPILDTYAYTTIWNGFQFRFRNNATVSGNNDHWNIDYVQLLPQALQFDATNNAFLSADFPDSGFSHNPPSMLRRYQAMPWNQFEGHEIQELKSTNEYLVGVTNTGSQPDNRTLTYTLKEICSDALLFESSGTGVEPNDIGNFLGNVPLNFFFRNNDIETALSDNAALFADQDSIILENRVMLSNVSTDTRQNNDTAYFHQKFFNYFAYDDGVAEKAYGLYGIGAKLAVRYHLNEPDTLRALQIAFVAQNQAIEQLPFKLAVWKSVDLNTNNAELLYLSSDTYNPQFLQQPNGLWTYILEQPLAVSDTIYVGFVQSDADFLPVAFDVNNNYGYDTANEINSEIVYNTSGYWYNSLYQGALLLRPVLGKAFNTETINVGIDSPNTTNNNDIKLYPNPTSTEFWVHSPNAHSLELYDCMGRLIAQQNVNHAVSVANLPQGIYIVKIYDAKTQAIGTEKVIVR
jgi:hypothetical protein